MQNETDVETNALKSKIEELLSFEQQDNSEHDLRNMSLKFNRKAGKYDVYKKPENQANPEYRNPFMLDEEEEKQDTQNQVFQVRNIIKTCLQVESEATMIKQKITGHNPSMDILPKRKNNLFAWNTQSEPMSSTLPKAAPIPRDPPKVLPPRPSGDGMSRAQQKAVREIIIKANQEEQEDVLMAMDLLNKYQKDKQFIQRDIDKQKHKSTLMSAPLTELQASRPKTVSNPALVQEQRHRAVQERRERRMKEQEEKLLINLAAKKQRNSSASGSTNLPSINQNTHGSKSKIASPEQYNYHSRVNRSASRGAAPNSLVAGRKGAIGLNKDINGVLNMTEKDFPEGVVRTAKIVRNPVGYTSAAVQEADVQLDKVRMAKASIDRKTEEFQAVQARAQAEIKAYKDAILEQQKSLKEQKNQEAVAKVLEAQKMKTHAQMERSQKELLNFKLNRFLISFSSTLAKKQRQAKSNAFDQINFFTERLRLLQTKLVKRQALKSQGKVIRAWAGAWRRIERSREEQRATEDARIQYIYEQQAQQKYDQRLIKKYFQAFVRNWILEKDANQIELEHQDRKRHIDDFFTGLKKKIKSEKQNKDEQNEKENLKSKVRKHIEVRREETAQKEDYMEYYDEDFEQALEEELQDFDKNQAQVVQATPSTQVNHPRDISGFSDYSAQPQGLDKSEAVPTPNISVQQFQDNSMVDEELKSEKVDSNIDEEIQIRNLQVSEMTETAESVQESQPSTAPESQKQKKKPLIPERPKQVLQMEERAKQRKERRELLKKQYDDKNQEKLDKKRELEEKKEMEFLQKKQDEKDAKRAQRLEEIRKKEVAAQEIKDLKFRLKAADDYYKRKLVTKFGINPFKECLKTLRQKEKLADQFKIQATKKFNLRILMKRMNAIQFVKAEQEFNQMKSASHYYDQRLKVKVLNTILGNVFESQDQVRLARKQVQKASLKSMYNQWLLRVDALRAERVTEEAKSQKIVNAYRQKKYGRMFIEALQVNIIEEQTNREKSEYKQKMRSKVSMWLSQLDDK